MAKYKTTNENQNKEIIMADAIDIRELNERIERHSSFVTNMAKIIIYQLFPRTFTNYCENRVCFIL